MRLTGLPKESSGPGDRRQSLGLGVGMDGDVHDEEEEGTIYFGGRERLSNKYCGTICAPLRYTYKFPLVRVRILPGPKSR